MTDLEQIILLLREARKELKQANDAAEQREIARKNQENPQLSLDF